MHKQDEFLTGGFGLCAAGTNLEENGKSSAEKR